MNKKEILSIGQGTDLASIYGTIMSMAASEMSKLTPQERAERQKHNRLRAEERIRQSKILKNICPDCEGKLSRGKKDKKNGYKRAWVCNNCNTTHSI